MMKKIATSFLIGIFFAVSSLAQTILLSDLARISLLTNSPWNGEVYAVFGHTAIRVSDEVNAIDHVFNYGVFDFNSPNFIFRFMRGETDYMVVAYPFDRYLEEYQARGVASYEQVLNLAQQEKQNIWDALCINSLPQNREYRYNFFLDNCSTRPRDIIEQNINGSINYSPSKIKNQTYRDLIHECVSAYPWLRFGIDLLIGSDADEIISDYNKMFLPVYLKHAYEGAVTVSDGTKRKMVVEEFLITGDAEEEKHLEPVDYPFVVGVILLVLTVVISVLSFRKYTLPGKIYDVLLFLLAGITGCVIAFLMFFSEHPATNPNWNIVWLNPVQLIIAFLIPVKYFLKAVYYYHFINFVFLSFFLLLWIFIPQQLDVAFIFFILSLWARSGTNFVQGKRVLKKI